MKNSQDDTDTVADAVIALTYDPRPLYNSGTPLKIKREMEHKMLDLRMRMKEAHRFVLENDFTRALVTASNAQPDVIRKRIPLAMLPFRSIWIEFDTRVRVDQQWKNGTSDAPADELYKMGYLLTRSDREQPAWTCEPFIYPSGKGVSPHIIVHGFRTPYPAHFGIEDYTPYDLGSKLWGYAVPHLPNDFKRLWWTAINGVSAPVILHSIAQSKANMEFWGKYIVEAADEARGDARFLVTALAVINHTPIELREVTQRGNHQVRFRNVQFLDHHVINIHAGRKNVVYLIDRTLKKAAAAHARHRAHEVRGHHRVLHKGTAEERTTWVKEHTRGDASLGWVRQTWSVQLSDAREMLP